MIILTYDIQDDKLRTEFSKYIKGYGRRLQYSVYEINNSRRILEIVKTSIKNKFEQRFSQADSILIFDLTDSTKIMRFGHAKNEESDFLAY